MRQPSALSLFAPNRYAFVAATLTSICLTGFVASALAGGYVDGNVLLNPATPVVSGGATITPTFNNDQFNSEVLVSAVNNDPVRTPSTSDPISTVSGNNYHDETDFVIRGRNDLNYVFTRTYNSAPSATKVDRGLGYGWTHSYSMRLKSNDFGDCPNCTTAQRPQNANGKTSSITYTDERGGEQNYVVNETTYAVTAPKGVYDTLVLDSPVVGQHTLTFRNGVKYIFEDTPEGNLKTMPNVVSRLKYIDDPWGGRLTLSYYDPVDGCLQSVTDNLGVAGRTGLVFICDISKRLTSVSDWTGRKWRFYYDATGNLTAKTNPLNQMVSYTYYPGSHLLNEVILPENRDGKKAKAVFRYYENGRAFFNANALGQSETLDYDLYRKSTRVTDPRGGIREYFYDDNGRMTKLTEPDGAVLIFENQDDAIRSKKFDALGYATTYSYRTDKAFTGTSTAYGQVTREQDAMNQTVDTTYGPFDQIATVKDKRGSVTTTTYATATSGCDYANRPKETRISALSGSTNVLLASYCWNSNGTPNYSRAYLDATRYRETRLTYQPGSNGLNVEQQQIVGMPSGVAITATYTYDSLGRKKTQTLKRRSSPADATLINLTTSYDYDALDRVTKATDALGNEVVNNYDANGKLWKITHRYKKPDSGFEERDVVTRTFDAADRVKTEADAEGNITTYTYDEAGNVIAVLDAEGHTTRFEYDAKNRRTAVIDATGFRTTTTYNLRGDVIGITNANGVTTTFEVDSLRRKTAAIGVNGYRTEFRYDENGNLTCSIDANAQALMQVKNLSGCSESRAYDQLNRVTKITDAMNGETNFTYDLLGNRLTVTDAEQKISVFNYDDLGRPLNEVDNSSLITRYKVDEAGNVYEKTNRLNEVTRLTYDNGNRLTRVDYLKDNSVETFGYDPAGNRNAAANGNIGYGFAWDRLNRLIQKTDSRGKNLSFTYDKVGNILTKTTYQGSTTSYLYNAANRLVQLRNPDYTQVDYQYDPAGRLLSRVTSAGARSIYKYDNRNNLRGITQYDAVGAQISFVGFGPDRAGYIRTQGDASGTTTYVYDGLYRLKTVDYPGTANDEAFSYDKVGNRKTYTKGSLTANANTRYYNYTTGTNRLAEIRIGSTTGTLESSFFYDAEGRLKEQIGVGAKTLTWDAKGRVSTLGAESYRYDPMDYRIGRSGGSLGNLDYYLEGEHLESVYSGNYLQAKFFRGSSIDELVAGYLYDIDGKLKPYLFHQDNVTSTTAVSGHDGGTTQSTSYTAFGGTLANTGSSPNRLKYTGREDDQTGLYYYRARYYDPSIGRFISEDPLGFGAGINFYAYVGNNPVNGNDPSGLRPPSEGEVGFLKPVFNDAISYGSIDIQKGSNWNPIASVALNILGRPAITLGNTIYVHPNYYHDDYSAAGVALGRQGLVVHETTHVWQNNTAGLVSTAVGSVVGNVTQGNEAYKYALSPATALQAGPPAPLSLFGVEQQASFVEDSFYVSMGSSPRSSSTYMPGDDISGLSSIYNGTLGSAGLGTSASGGFLLYPNKPNLNTLQQVYSK